MRRSKIRGGIGQRPCEYIYIYIYIHNHWHLISGGTTCLTLLVYYGLICCAFRSVQDHHNSLHDSPRLKTTCVRHVVLDKSFPLFIVASFEFLLSYVPLSSLRRLGAKDFTPEINTSEIIVDFQWHFPTDCQWYFPTESHFSAVLSKGLPLPGWMFTGIVQWTFGDIFQQHFT